MKKTILLSLLSLSLSAQVQKKIKAGPLLSESKLQSAPANTLYAFSTFTAAYQSFTGVSLTAGKKWDDAYYPVALGFNFKLYSTTSNTINFSEGSYATFDDPNSVVITLISPIFEDLCDRAFNPSIDSDGDPGGISDISYTVTGTSGSRICKVQVTNAGFYGEIDANGTSVSFVNFQLWLYEGSSDIEFRYGAVDIQNPSDNLMNPLGFVCGLAEQVDLITANNQSSNALNGPHANPSMVALSNTLAEVITGNIQSGRVYRFARVNPNPVGISALKPAAQISLYPNPASKTLYCKVSDDQKKGATLSFYSLDGRFISSNALTSEMSLSGLDAGIYFIKAESVNGSSLYSGKLVITE